VKNWKKYFCVMTLKELHFYSWHENYFFISPRSAFFMYFLSIFLSFLRNTQKNNTPSNFSFAFTHFSIYLLDDFPFFTHSLTHASYRARNKKKLWKKGKLLFFCVFFTTSSSLSHPLLFYFVFVSWNYYYYYWCFSTMRHTHTENWREWN
jgi:hypothetical protein